MKNIERISELHTFMWRFHDEKKWDELEKSAKELILLWGYTANISETVAPCVVETFQLADSAENARISGDIAKEVLQYKKLQRKFENIYELLGTNKKAAKFKVGWIYATRHKRIVPLFLNLFLEHLALFSNRKPITVLKLTLISIKDVYRLHNIHDWKKLKQAFIKYWLTMQKSLGKEEKLLPQF